MNGGGGENGTADEGGTGGVALRLGQSLLMMFAAFLAAAVVAPWAERLGLAVGLAPESPELVTIRTVGQFVGFILAAVVFLTYANDRDLVPVRLPSAREAAVGLAAAGGLVVAQFVLLFGLTAVGVDVATNRALTPGRDNPTYYLYMVVVSVLLVGPAEELVFRGVVQGELRKALSPAPAIVLAAFLFGSIHFLAGTGTFIEQAAYVFVATLLAIPLGYLYEVTGNLTVPALAHGTYNAVLYLIQYADATLLV